MDNRLDFRNLFSISGLRLFISIIPYLGNIYIARKLDVEIFGQYFFFLSVVPFILSLFALNIHAGYRVIYSKQPEISESVSLNIFVFCQALALLAFIFLFIFENNFRLLGFSVLEIALLCFFCHLSVCISLMESSAIIIQSARHFIYFVALPVIFGWIFSLYIFDLSLSWQLRVLFYSTFIYIVYFFYFTRLCLKSGIKNIFLGIKDMLNIGGHLVLPTYLISFYVFIDRYFLKLNLSDIEFGAISYILQLVLILVFGFQVLTLLYEQLLLRSTKISKFLNAYWYGFYSFLSILIIAISFMLSEYSEFLTKTIFLSETPIDSILIILVSILALVKVIISIESVNYYVKKQQAKIFRFYLLALPLYLIIFADLFSLYHSLVLLIIGNLIVVLTMILYRTTRFRITLTK